jgi:hypothetical protein
VWESLWEEARKLNKDDVDDLDAIYGKAQQVNIISNRSILQKPILFDTIESEKGDRKSEELTLKLTDMN